MDANLISDPRRQRECCTGSVGGQQDMIHEGSECSTIYNINNVLRLIHYSSILFINIYYFPSIVYFSIVISIYLIYK